MGFRVIHGCRFQELDQILHKVDIYVDIWCLIFTFLIIYNIYTSLNTKDCSEEVLQIFRCLNPIAGSQLIT